jgi:hypothetical protein
MAIPAKQSSEYHLRGVIQWCDEEIGVLLGEMVAQGGSDWHGEFPNPTGLLDNLHETRKTARAILKEIQSQKTKSTWASPSPTSPTDQGRQGIESQLSIDRTGVATHVGVVAHFRQMDGGS